MHCKDRMKKIKKEKRVIIGHLSRETGMGGYFVRVRLYLFKMKDLYLQRKTGGCLSLFLRKGTIFDVCFLSLIKRLVHG